LNNVVEIINEIHKYLGISEIERKKQGEFFTPTIWVDEAHQMISDQFGSDWKEKYIVWDCAWGTGNLTRDYKFSNLFCSTLHDSDINTAKQMKINPEATKFQFDFLNDDLELLKEPDYAPELYKALQEGKEILFLINPPYGTSSGNKNLNGIKKNISTNFVGEEMKLLKMGDAQKQLYTQFLYRISKLKNNVKISLFSPTAFLTGVYYKKFRKLFYDDFNFCDGFIMNSTEFADVKSWSLSFSIWNNSEIIKTNKCIYYIKELDDNLEIKNINKKEIYNTDYIKSANKWIRENNNFDKIGYPQTSSALNTRKNGNGAWFDKSIGFFYNAGNSIQTNTTNQSLFTLPFYGDAQGFPFGEDKLKIISSIFTARKSIQSNWKNDKDEYIAPTEAILNSPNYIQWNNDAIVYSLFNTSSNQSSMRQIEYKEKLWDIKNEFFWMSKKEMMDMAEEQYFDELYTDARNSEERYVYKTLQNITLSPDAQELLDLSKELIKKSFKMRKFMNNEHPEYHLNTWDAGWYQMKKVLKEYHKEDYNEFVKKYKAFEDRMRPYVYKFGFLK